MMPQAAGFCGELDRQARRDAGRKAGRQVGKVGGQSRQVGPGQQTMAGRGAGRSDGGLAG